LIVDFSQDAIIAKDLAGIITHWNKGAEQVYGYAADEVIGESIEFLHPTIAGTKPWASWPRFVMASGSILLRLSAYGKNG
jgi:PAS domain-containing protein